MQLLSWVDRGHLLRKRGRVRLWAVCERWNVYRWCELVQLYVRGRLQRGSVRDGHQRVCIVTVWAGRYLLGLVEHVIHSCAECLRVQLFYRMAGRQLHRRRRRVWLGAVLARWHLL